MPTAFPSAHSLRPARLTRLACATTTGAMLVALSGCYYPYGYPAYGSPGYSTYPSYYSPYATTPAGTADGNGTYPLATDATADYSTYPNAYPNAYPATYPLYSDYSAWYPYYSYPAWGWAAPALSLQIGGWGRWGGWGGGRWGGGRWGGGGRWTGGGRHR